MNQVSSVVFVSNPGRNAAWLIYYLDAPPTSRIISLVFWIDLIQPNSTKCKTVYMCTPSKWWYKTKFYMCSTAICKPLNFTIVSLWCNINLLLFYTYRVSSHAWTSWRTVSVMYKEYLSCQTNLQWAPCILCCLLLFRLSRPHSHTVRSVNEFTVQSLASMKSS